MADYANGFKDGFAAGLEEGKKMNDKTYTDGLIEGMKKTMPPSYVSKETCPKCGITISGVMNYTCQSINCPTFYRTWTGPSGYNDWTAGSYGSVGAVGSMSTNYESSAPGTNGPAGPTEPIDYYKG
jgi:hypothetical protein